LSLAQNHNRRAWSRTWSTRATEPPAAGDAMTLQLVHRSAVQTQPNICLRNDALTVPKWAACGSTCHAAAAMQDAHAETY
jgi:hypothetical protein